MARTQAFDWLSTFLLAGLILIVPILFVVWINPGLLDRLQEEIAGSSGPVGPRDAPVAPPASEEESSDGESGPYRNGGDRPAPPSRPSQDGYIATPGSSALADRDGAVDKNREKNDGESRTAAKPVAEEAAESTDDPSGVFDESPEPDRNAAGETGSAAAASGEASPTGDASTPATPPIDPVTAEASGEKTSTNPESLAVPPVIAPSGATDVDGDGDQGGLRAVDGAPGAGAPTPAAPVGNAGAAGANGPSANAATPAATEASSDEEALASAAGAVARHEELLREIRALATSQRSLEGRFDALREEIDGRLTVLKSVVDGVAANGSATEPGEVDESPDDAETLPTSSAPGSSSGEQARAARATKILRATLDGKLTLEVGDDERTTIDFVYVPPGRFRLGRTAAEQQAAAAGTVAAPAQEIVVDRGFFISEREVSDEQFVAFLRANYSDDPKLDAVLAARNDLDRPASKVTWPMAKFFCLWASDSSKFDVRLPTEIEWEYAARGPYSVLRPAAADEGASATSVATSARDVGDDPADRSWCGAVDLWGNVAEWCADLYDADAYSVDDSTSAKVYSPAAAPEDWLSSDPGGRSVRGGSYADPVDSRDYSERRQAKAAASAATLGFRVVLIPDFDGEAEVGRLP